MKEIKLGTSGISVVAIGYGCWRFTESTFQVADSKIRTALECGMTLIDTSDIYGLDEARGFRGAEEVLGDVFKTSPELRGQMILTAKGGIDAVRTYDSRYNYLMAAMDKSLTRLRTDYVDLYQVHRPDITTPMFEIGRVLNDMVKAGKRNM